MYHVDLTLICFHSALVNAPFSSSLSNNVVCSESILSTRLVKFFLIAQACNGRLSSVSVCGDWLEVLYLVTVQISLLL